METTRLNQTRFTIAILLGLLCQSSVSLAQNVSGYPLMPDPLLFLLREPAVHKDLALKKTQYRNLVKLNQSFDSQLLASRNRPPQDAQAMTQTVMTKTRQAIQQILTEEQQDRLKQIAYRLRGMSFVIMPEPADALALTDDQRQEIGDLVKQTRETITSLNSSTYQGAEAHEQAQKDIYAAQRAEQDGIVAALTDSQKRTLATLVGDPFDSSKLGRVMFKAPELADGDTWINSDELKLKELRGQVVAVHFWAFGCINCIHNYPWYKEWEAEFEGKDFQIIGIHTPETNAERDVDSVRQKTKKAGFGFPVVVDNEKSNWKNWGNSMWPAVYLVDKRGRVRYWWYGELNWKGAGGQNIMNAKIKELLAE